jgi:two-component system, cell cycle sensor histidine kinase and response regulator CckA
MAELQETRARFIRAVKKYGMTLGAALAAFLVEQALLRVLGREAMPPFMVLYPCVLVVAFALGLGPGLLSTATAALLTALQLSAVHALTTGAQELPLVLFIVMGASMSAAAEAYRRAQEKAAVHITERKRSEEKLLRVIQDAPVGIIIVNGDGKIQLMNAQAEGLFGYGRDELIGQPIETLLPGRFRSRHPDHRTAYSADPRPLPPGMGRDDLYGLRRDGQEFPVDIGLNRITVAEETLVVASIIDVTERKRIEAALRESEERFRLLVDGVQESFILQEVITDDGGKPVDLLYRMVNPAAEKQLGKTQTDLVGHLRSEVEGPLDTETSELITRVLTGGNPMPRERHDPRTGRWHMVFAYSPRPGHFASLSLDVTERKLFEEKMLQTQKLESLGVLAGGIAHDFNNILQAVLGNAELAASTVSLDSSARGNLQEISRAARRAGDLTRQMLACSGMGTFQVQPLDLSQVIMEMQEMLRVSVSRKATVQFSLASGLPCIQADLAQIHQVITNLMVNASEAIGESSGTIRVSTASTDCDRAFLDSVWGGEQLTEGRYVSLQVADTGCGMDEGTMARIFDPFFSTKFTGRGLGLAAVNGIVRGHKGAIRVRSAPGRGTTFTVLFPAGPAPSRPSEHTEMAHGRWRGNGAVLLVDDEEGIRNVGRQMLERLGFSVVTSRDGREALEWLTSHPKEVAFVILDLTMPAMDGMEAFRAIHAIAPDLKVILSSGYNEQAIFEQGRTKGLAGFIQKPYQLAALEQKLRDILGSAEHSPRASAPQPPESGGY